MKKYKVFFDVFFWFLVAVLPFFAWLFAVKVDPQVGSFLAYVDSNFAFDYIKDIFDSISSLVFDVPFVLNGFLSYLVGVEVFHVLFDVVVFVPRFAHKVIDWGVNKW